MQARSLEECLRADDGLARVSGHAARLLRLQRIFEASAPRPLVRSARVANLKLGRLIIHADSGAVAAKLRQITPTLVDVFKKESAEVTGIEVKVQPRTARTAAPPAPDHGPLGDHAKQGLTSLADRLPEDSPLRQALRHLLKRV
ncbi:hypothetical protein RHDC4_01870 [Rhodocyclaceae bacterium]|nr:hypothetical protein RHDC4_01870 [Rhodocyclaceae bacterium]